MITVLSGSNSHAVYEKLAELKREFTDQHGSGGTETYGAEQIEPEQLGGLIAGATLFASHRFIVLKAVAEHKLLAESLLSQLGRIPEEVHLVLVEGRLDKRTAFYRTLQKEAAFLEFAEVDESAATSWVGDQITEQGGEITPAVAHALVQAAGTNQSRLAQEVAKLLAYDKKVTAETVELLVEKNPKDTIFQLLDFALGGRKQQALQVLAGLERAHEDPFQVASMLIWQTHILAVVHSAEGAADTEVAKSTKINPFVVKKTRSLAAKMDKRHLQHIIDTVASLDVGLKTGSTNPWFVLEHAILSL